MPCLLLPEQDGALIGPTGQQTLISTPGHRPGPTNRARKRVQQLSSAHLPHLDGPITTGSRQEATVGTEGHRAQPVASPIPGTLLRRCPPCTSHVLTRSCSLL